MLKWDSDTLWYDSAQRTRTVYFIVYNTIPRWSRVWRYSKYYTAVHGRGHRHYYYVYGRGSRVTAHGPDHGARRIIVSARCWDGYTLHLSCQHTSQKLPEDIEFYHALHLKLISFRIDNNIDNVKSATKTKTNTDKESDYASLHN